MKKIRCLYLFSFCFSILFLSSCASSERMTRLSGGVIGEYSAPAKHRLRKSSFQVKGKKYSSDTKGDAHAFARKSLINIWPFFFRSDDYFSILWPFIDYDQYGFAFRPILNKEGNDVSILFPLSNWNMAEKEGWLLNFYLHKKGFLFFPIAGHKFHETDGWFFYTPFLIRSWQKYKGQRRPGTTPKETDFTELLLGYYKKKVYIDAGKNSYLWGWKAEELSPYMKAKLQYDLKGKNVPRNKKEFLAYRDKVFASLPDKSILSCGFFPLLAINKTKEKEYWDMLIALFLWKGERKENHFSHGAILNFLYHYERLDHKYDSVRKRGGKFPYGLAGKKLFSCIPLLLGFQWKEYYRKTAQLMMFRNLKNRINYNLSFEKYRKELEEDLKKIDKNIKMPPYINCWRTFDFFLTDLAKKYPFETYKQYEGGFLPLYIYKFNEEEKYKQWVSPVLLTGYKKDKEKEGFFSLPLLTWMEKTKKREVYTTCGHIGYYGKKVFRNRFKYPIFPQNTMQVKEYQQSEYIDEYALCGLYYHGKDGFYVAKENVDAALVESIRKRSYSLRRDLLALEREKKEIGQRKKKNANMKVKTKIDHYRKLIDEEEIKLLEKKYTERNRKYRKNLASYLADGKKIGASLREEALKDEKKFHAMLEKFFTSFTRIRYSEDIGSGIFFRKERFENGDHSWRAFLLLAGGEKKGAREKTQILHFFYRYNKEGVKEEKLIFPFISIQKDKDYERISFLWRLYERTIKNGRTSGHIFFIPYGK